MGGGGQEEILWPLSASPAPQGLSQTEQHLFFPCVKSLLHFDLAAIAPSQLNISNVSLFGKC